MEKWIIAYYGTSGPIIVDTQESPFLPIWFEAGTELGYKTGDPNGFQTESFTPVNKPTRNGRRSSTYFEFIKPYEESRDTLTVVRYANVSEVILLNENKEAYGVAYTRHGSPQITHASKEVILSAGFFSSPLLLMKSGIGPVETLEAAEIPVKVALPAVGKNVSEHACMILGPFYVNNNDTSFFHHLFKPEDTEKVVEEYQRGEGPLAAVADGPQRLKVSSRAEPGWPNLFISAHLTPIILPGGRPTVVFPIVLGRPKGKGYINLNTTAYKEGIKDDVQLAGVDFHFLEHDDDVEDLVEGIQFTFNITRTNAFQNNFNLTYTRDPSPGCNEQNPHPMHRPFHGSSKPWNVQTFF